MTSSAALTTVMASSIGACMGCATIVGADFDVSARPDGIASGDSLKPSGKVTAPNADVQYLGLSVAVQGDTAFIGSSDNTWTGQVYVSRRFGGEWRLTRQTLTAEPDQRPNAQFGSSVALSGDNAIIGARGPDLSTSDQEVPYGSVYFFRRNGDDWFRVGSEIHAPVPVDNDQFGTRVAIQNDVAVVGAPSILTGSQVGAVHIYELSDGEWSWRQSLEPADGALGDNFGYELALSGTLLAVGARWNDEAGTDAGAVYLYEKSGSEWVPARTHKLTPRPSGADWYRFGEGTIGLDQGRLMVAAPSAPLGAQVNAYALDESGDWAPERFDPPPGLTSRADPGWRTAIKGNDAIVVGTSNDVGMGLHYRYSDGAWRFVRRLESGFSSNDVFGWTIAYDGATACFGAIFYGDKDGAAFFFDLSP